MNLSKAQSIAIEMIQKHCPGWRFAWNNRKSAFGVCSYQKRTIFLSMYLTSLSEEADVRNTILHEIAHTRAPGDNHGPKWYAECVKLGMKSPSRISVAPEGMSYKYRMVYGSMVLKSYNRKPNESTYKKLPHLYLPSRPQSKGCLEIITEHEYNRRLKMQRAA